MRMEGLFGTEMPLAVKFFIAFVVVLALILGIAWALRRFGAAGLGVSARGRQPRLSITEFGPRLDARRQLILVRRDNVEHLLVIGGPTDFVVEANIVRATASPRDISGTRPAVGMEALPRAIPLPENGGSWPLQPEPAGAPRPAARLEPLPEELPQRLDLPQRLPQAAEPPAPPRPQRDTLAALADELGSRAAPPPPRRPVFNRPPAAEPRVEAKMEPHVELPDEPVDSPQSAPAIVPPAAPPSTPVAAPAAAAAPAGEADQSLADQSLADMASRLEAALRKPGTPPEPRRPAAPPRPPAQAAESALPADALPPLPTRAPRPEPKPARAEPKPAAPSGNQASNQGNKTALYDSLEQEMASLLGRPTKT
jgi:flagellar protein FliO/FliZ